MNELLAALARSNAYDRGIALAAEALARDATCEWSQRRVAVLMLETSLLRLRDKAARRQWVERLGMTDAGELRREGYAERPSIDVQLWRRMERLARVHRLLPDDVDGYVRAAECECRLTLARYLFTADEIIARIDAQMRRSDGIPDHETYGQFRGESQRALDALPRLERAIAAHFAPGAHVRWVSASTTNEVDALVSQPLGTVVMTIRPPGSAHELQIKRAGRPRPLPLDVVWQRDGKPVTPTHHLDGGSELNSIAYEAEHGSFFSRVFREVHGVDAAMSRSVAVARVDTLPLPGDGEADLMEYFDTPAAFGERFFEMRWNLYHAVRLLARERGEPLVPGDDAELTRQFIRRTKPAQAIQSGTTALRLNRLHCYLSADGADAYFGERGVAHDANDDRRFADHLLDEILGVYDPPRVAWRSHGQWIDAALLANRARVERVYVSLFEQIGRFWGTLLGVRGHSRGESFVERNSGLRSVWSDGQWQVRIVFMDHDSLTFAARATNSFRPFDAMQGTIIDADHIVGGMLTAVRTERGEAGCLREIYRASDALHHRALAALETTARAAYDATQRAMANGPLAGLFARDIIDHLRDSDDVVRVYLANRGGEWQRDVHALLVSRGLIAPAIAEHVTALETYGRSLERLAFLFRVSPTERPRRRRASPALRPADRPRRSPSAPAMP